MQTYWRAIRAGYRRTFELEEERRTVKGGTKTRRKCVVERNREEWNLKIQRASTLWAAVRAAGSICSANERKKGTKETSPRRGGRTGDRLFLLFFLSLSLSPRGVLSTGRAHVDRHRFNARSIAIFSNIKRKEAASKVSRRSVTQESTIRDPLLFYLSLSRNVYFETRVFLKEERKSVRPLMLVEILAEIREGGGRERWKKGERGEGARGEQRGTCSQSPVHSGIVEGE